MTGEGTWILRTDDTWHNEQLYATRESRYYGSTIDLGKAHHWMTKHDVMQATSWAGGWEPFCINLVLIEV